MFDENLSYFFTLQPMDFILYVFKILIITLGSTYSYYKILNSNFYFRKRLFICLVLIILSAFISYLLKLNAYKFLNVSFLILAFSFIISIYDKKDIMQLFFTSIVTLSINFILYFFSTFLCFIPNLLINIHSDVINFILISLIYFFNLIFLFKMRKFRNGISFFNNISYQEVVNILILNIGSVVLFTYSLFSDLSIDIIRRSFPAIILFAIIMFITIQKSITLYYKHNLLEKELNDLKAEVENKNKEIAELEKENLDFIKSSHSIAHKQKSLEYKINKLQNSYEFADELDITDEFNKIANANSSVVNYSLVKTEITEIDDMLEFLQSECSTNNINFDLILSGNIHYIINNYISIDNLQILLADHIKDAIIAIKNSDNINRSILVKIGLFDNVYSIHIFDSGIEFEIDTFNKLGSKPITTHSKDGGTGLGFMNTFDTLNKTSASLCINEIGKPCIDNFTKEIIISFDNLHKLEIKSYRFTDLSNTLKNSNFEILNND